MTEKFEPEIGQIAHGNPWQDIPCPNYIIACLREISYHIEHYWTNHDIYHSAGPAENSGTEFVNDIFEMRAYVWNEDSPKAQLPNFKYKDFEILWYKYLGRGTSMNRKIDSEEFIKIFDHCLASLENSDDQID